MNCNFGQQSNKTARFRGLFAAALVIGCALSTATNAEAEQMTAPATSIAITPPEGNAAFLLGRALGTQGYVCLPSGTGASWTVNGARPEATLFRTFFGQDVPDRHPLPQPRYQPQRSSHQTRCPSPTRRGRAPSIAAKCGRSRCTRFPPAPTRVARMPGRSPASCCSPSGRKRDQPAVNS